MAIRDYIERNQLFSRSELLEACGDGQTNRNLLSRAVKSGAVIKLGGGLYASACGRFAGAAPDRLEVASRLFPGCAFRCATALELLGAAHNASPRLVTCLWPHRRDVAALGVRYVCAPSRTRLPTMRAKRGARCTTPEATFVDAICNPSLSGGLESCVRSIASLDVDPDEVMETAMSAGAPAARKAALALSLITGEASAAGRLAGLPAPHRRVVIGQAAEMRYDPRFRVWYPAEMEGWAQG